MVESQKRFMTIKSYPKRTFNLFANCLAAALCIGAVNCSSGKSILFYEVPRNYGEQGSRGEIFRQEFEPRMFTHSRWHERLYINPYEPDIDDTLETYSKSDGSRWIGHRRATPSLSRIVGPSVSGEHYDTRKELEEIRISSQEVALPAAVANEIGLLWRKMLPGSPSEPKTHSTMHVLYIHPPAFIAFARENQSVKTGRIAAAAFDTPAYRAFGDIVDDLLRACDGDDLSRKSIFTHLPEKIRHLREQL